MIRANFKRQFFLLDPIQYLKGKKNLPLHLSKWTPQRKVRNFIQDAKKSAYNSILALDDDPFFKMFFWSIQILHNYFI